MTALKYFAVEWPGDNTFFIWAPDAQTAAQAACNEVGAAPLLGTALYVICLSAIVAEGPPDYAHHEAVVLPFHEVASGSTHGTEIAISTLRTGGAV